MTKKINNLNENSGNINIAKEGSKIVSEVIINIFADSSQNTSLLIIDEKEYERVSKILNENLIKLNKNLNCYFENKESPKQINEFEAKKTIIITVKFKFTFIIIFMITIFSFFCFLLILIISKQLFFIFLILFISGISILTGLIFGKAL